MTLADQLIGVTKGTYKAISKTVIENGKHNQTFLVIVCECGVAKNIAPSYFDQDKIPKCACNGGKMGGRQYKYWDDKMDEYNIELLEKLDEHKAKRRQRELDKLKTNYTRKRSEKMVIT